MKKKPKSKKLVLEAEGYGYPERGSQADWNNCDIYDIREVLNCVSHVRTESSDRPCKIKVIIEWGDK